MLTCSPFSTLSFFPVICAKATRGREVSHGARGTRTQGHSAKKPEIEEIQSRMQQLGMKHHNVENDEEPVAVHDGDGD